MNKPLSSPEMAHEDYGQPHSTADHSPRRLRQAGLAALGVFLAMIITPIIVITTDLFSNVDYSDPLTKQDPLTNMNDPAFGVIFGAQSLVVAGGIAVMVVSIRRLQSQSLGSDLMLVSGLLAISGWAFYGGSAAQSYSRILQGDILSVQPDPAIRAMVGYSQIGFTQGLVGAAGVALMMWALLLHHSSGNGGLTGKLFRTLSWVLAVAAVASYVLGLGGFATVLSMPVMLMIAVTLLRRSRV